MKIKYVILVLVLVWFSCFMAATIDMPEVDGDEALHGMVMLNFLKKKTSFEHNFRFMGMYFPTMSSKKHGAAEVYLLMPFMLLWGTSLEAMRSGYILWTILAVIMAYYFSSSFFNDRVSAIAVCLLACSYPFLEYMKLGPVFGLTTVFFSLASLACFYNWHTHRQNKYFYLGMFLLAIGYQARGWFIWFILGFLISAFIFYLPRHKIRMKTALAGLGFFILGIYPIAYLYAKTDFIRFAINNIAVTSEFGVNNFNILQNILLRLKHLNSLLAGPSGNGYFFYIYPVLFFWLCLLFLLFVSGNKKEPILVRSRVMFMLILFCATSIFSIFTFTKHREGHLLILFPYIQIIAAMGVYQAFRMAGNKLIKSAVVLLSALFIFVNIARYCEGYRQLREEKEEKVACSIPILVQWLEDNDIDRFTGADYQMVVGVLFTGGLKILPNWLLYDKEEENKTYLFSVMKKAKKEEVFIFSCDTDKPYFDDFQRFAGLLNREVVLRNRLFFKNGNVRYNIYSLK